MKLGQNFEIVSSKSSKRDDRYNIVNNILTRHTLQSTKTTTCIEIYTTKHKVFIFIRLRIAFSHLRNYLPLPV